MGTSQVKSPKVLGVLSITFGSICILFGLIGFILSAGMSSFSMSAASQINGNLFAAMSKLYSAFNPIYIGMFIFSVILIFVGINQLRYKSIAKMMTLYWSSAALLSLVLLSVYSVLYLGTVYVEYMNAAMMMSVGKPMLSSSYGTLIGAVLAFFNLLFYAPYPIIMLIVFRKEKVTRVLVN